MVMSLYVTYSRFSEFYSHLTFMQHNNVNCSTAVTCEEEWLIKNESSQLGHWMLLYLICVTVRCCRRCS